MMGAQVVGLLTFALGCSNGHLTACAMMTAPRDLPKPQAEVAGMLSALCLVFGIVLGSCTGLLL
jgi:equilibrative nucleoside transporter 1/2/3